MYAGSDASASLCFDVTILHTDTHMYHMAKDAQTTSAAMVTNVWSGIVRDVDVPHPHRLRIASQRIRAGTC